MSASEKLKALEDDLRQIGKLEIDGAPGPMALVRTLNALPRIRAVVEAAERVDRYAHQYEGAMIELGWTFADVRAFSDLRPALAALDEELPEIGRYKVIDRFSWNSRDGVTFDANDEALS